MNRNETRECFKTMTKKPAIRIILANLCDGLIALVPMAAVTFSGWILVFFAKAAEPPLAGTIAGLLAMLSFLIGMIWCSVYLLFRDKIGKGRSLGKRIFGIESERYED